MYTLENKSLDVTILDPIADQERFGTRYCTGGYIFQVADAEIGPLLTGPTYPDSFNTFDGQGIPDAFNLGPLRDHKAEDALALIIGVGVCDLKKNEVEEFCVWEVEQREDAIRMLTKQAFQAYGVELERTVGLYGRTVRSQVRLKNSGRAPFGLRWFPHPFFPQPETDELCRFNLPVSFPENQGYELADSGFIRRKGWPWTEGYYQALDHGSNLPLSIVQKHPKLGLIAATCSYIPTFFPIWGNPNTFSWEPFLERLIAPGQEMSWSIDYDF